MAKKGGGINVGRMLRGLGRAVSQSVKPALRGYAQVGRAVGGVARNYARQAASSSYGQAARAAGGVVADFARRSMKGTAREPQQRGWGVGRMVSAYGGGGGGRPPSEPSAPSLDDAGRSYVPDGPGEERPKSSGGGHAPDYSLDIARLHHQAQMAQIAENARQFNVTDFAQQGSASAAAGGLGNLVNEYNRAFAEARHGYERDYQQMLGIADQTTSQRKADIHAQYAQQGATGMQNLQRLGMANTTLAPTMQQGLQREQASSLDRLADEMQKTKLGIIGGRKAARELAPDTTMLQAATATGASAAGHYGGAITKTLGGLQFGGY